MIDWWLDNFRSIARWSRWIIAGCALALAAIATLPRGPVDRFVAIVGLFVIAVVFALALGTLLIAILHPQLVTRLRARRQIR